MEAGITIAIIITDMDELTATRINTEVEVLNLQRRAAQTSLATDQDLDKRTKPGSK